MRSRWGLNPIVVLLKKRKESIKFLCTPRPGEDTVVRYHSLAKKMSTETAFLKAPGPWPSCHREQLKPAQVEETSLLLGFPFLFQYFFS